MIGRGGAWQATFRKPARLSTMPVDVALGVSVLSSGYASSAGAEQVLERGPEFWSDWANREFHTRHIECAAIVM